jgi:hypothetical protein
LRIPFSVDLSAWLQADGGCRLCGCHRQHLVERQAGESDGVAHRAIERQRRTGEVGRVGQPDAARVIDVHAHVAQHVVAGRLPCGDDRIGHENRIVRASWRAIIAFTVAGGR